MKIRLYSIDKEGHKIILCSIIVLALLAGGFLLTPLASIGWLKAIFMSGLFVLLFLIIRFFRIPDRDFKLQDNAVVAPADGKVVAIEKIFVDEFLQEERIQISIFMSILNVHANWYPMAGEVVYFNHHHGTFLVANNPKSSTQNERTSIGIKHNGELILMRQIAGYVARRIVSYANVGDKVKQNQRCGFIKFGSRVDVLLPLDYEIKVKLNDKVTATQSVLAEKPIK
ncbi:MAG: phosphatidylserine decarboxylase family protein [Bacteroidetes bacterium]|nr:phosphatidylserine decarboxylase family protein [Bacteroidota bacterium]